MAKVGTAYVEIKPDLTGFAATLKARLDAIHAEKKVEIKPDMKAFLPAMLAGMTGMDKALENKVGQAIKKSKPEKEAGPAGRRAGKAFTDSFAKTVKTGFSLKLGQMGPILGAISVFAGPLAAVLNQAAAAAVGLGAALAGAALGGGAALLGTVLSLGQAFATIKVATAGMGTAVKAQAKIFDKLNAGLEVTDAETHALAEAMAKLSPAAKAVVKQLGALTKPLQDMRQVLQESLFAGFADEIKALADDLLPTLQAGLADTAVSLNKAGLGFTAFLRQASTTARVRTIMAANAVTVGTLAQALVPLTNAALILFTAIQPLVNIFAKMVLHGAQIASQFLAAGEASGRLAGVVGQLANSFTIFMSILGNVGQILGGVFRGAIGPGNTLLAMLDNVTGKWANWVNSVAGENAIRDWVAKAMPVMHELGQLIKDIFVALGKLGAGADTASFVAGIRGILPPLTDLLVQLSNPNTGGNLAAGLASIADSLVKMNAGGILQTTITLTAQFLSLFATMVTSVPGGTQVMGAFLTVWAGFAALKFSATITGLSKLPGLVAGTIGFAKALMGVSLAADASAASITGYTLATKLQAIASKVAAVATELWSAVTSVSIVISTYASIAFRAMWLAITGPVGLVIIAILAVVAGFVLLYKHSQTFRNIVQAALHAVAAAGLWLWGVLKVVFAAIVVAFKAIVVAAQWVGNILAPVFNVLRAVFTAWIMTVIAVIRIVIAVAMAYFQLVKSILMAIGAFFAPMFSAIITAVKWVFNLIVSAVQGYITIIVTIFTAIVDAVKWVWDKIVEGFNAIVDFFSAIWDTIKAIFTGATQAVDDTVGDKLRAIWDKIKEIFDKVVDFIRGVWDTIKDLFYNAWLGYMQIVTGGVDGVVDYIHSLPGKIMDALGNLGSLLIHVGEDLVRGLWEGIQGMAGWLAEKIVGWAKRVIPGPLLKFFDMGSPSKLMRDLIGKPIPQGIAVGMLADKDKVVNAAITLGQAAIPVVNPQYAGMAAVAGVGGIGAPVYLRVTIGDTELNDLVSAQVVDHDTATAYQLVQGRRGGF